MTEAPDATGVRSAEPTTAIGRGQTAHLYVRESLRLAILNGQLPGGSRLVQSDLAKQLDVSTTPVREALRDLAAESLIHIDPHRGAVVSELDHGDLVEVYQIRRRLERLALELALPLVSDEALNHAQELHQTMSAAPQSAAWVQLNREFHMTIFEASKLTRLISLIRTLQNASVTAISARLQRGPNLRETANTEHGQLLDAVRRRDLDEAVAVLLYHLSLSIRE